MNSALTSRDFGGGIVCWSVRMGGMVASGTASEGSRPTSWTVTLGRSVARHDSGSVRRSYPLRGAAMSRALRAIEAGRV